MLQGIPHEHSRARRIWSGAAAFAASGALLMGMVGTAAAASPTHASATRLVNLTRGATTHIGKAVAATGVPGSCGGSLEPHEARAAPSPAATKMARDTPNSPPCGPRQAETRA